MSSFKDRIETIISASWNYNYDVSERDKTIEEITILAEYHYCKWYQVFKKRKLLRKIKSL